MVAKFGRNKNKYVYTDTIQILSSGGFVGKGGGGFSEKLSTKTGVKKVKKEGPALQKALKFPGPA